MFTINSKNYKKYYPERIQSLHDFDFSFFETNSLTVKEDGVYLNDNLIEKKDYTLKDYSFLLNLLQLL